MPALKYLDTATGTYKTIGLPWINSNVLASLNWGDSVDARPDLDSFGSDPTIGQPIYVDSTGKLRAQPQVLAIDSRALTDPVSAYPIGMSLLTLSSLGASSGNWPSSGGVFTLRRLGDTDATSNAVQWHFPSLTGNTIVIRFRTNNGTGWGPFVQVGGMYSDLQTCTTNTTLSTTAITDMVGATLTVPVRGTDSVYMVNCTWDVTMLAQTAVAFLGRLSVGGADQTQAQAVWIPGTTAPVNCRQMVSQIFRVTGLTTGNVVFKLTASCSTANLYRVSQAHSNIAVTQVA